MSERRELGDVLVATDFTTHAAQAAARAGWLPLERGACISLVHVLPELPLALMDDERAAAESLLHTVAERIADERKRARLPEVDIFPTVLVGPPAERIADRARDEQAELVLVGSGRVRGPVDRVLGTMAERIVRACDRSVLVVAQEPRAEYLRPLVAVDLSPLSRRNVEVALQVARATALNVLLAHTLPAAPRVSPLPLSSEKLRRLANDEELRAEQQLERWIAENGDVPAKLHARVRQGDPAHAILEAVESEHADLLVLGTRGHSTFLHLALGSVTERVLRRARCDVLAVREAAP